jgi:3-phosphoshikimate 1-carboxyvinyltransferase
MNKTLQKSAQLINKKTLTISGSKSESNRLLLLQAIYPNINIENLSNSDDTKYLEKALSKYEEWQNNGSNAEEVLQIDIHHAGTAMRFLTAFFAFQSNLQVVLTGSSRMQERPIKILVDALREIGAKISYEKNEGFPPLKIIGSVPSNNEVNLKADVSSQYITALMLMASSFKKGLKINLEGNCTSIPYIKMTESFLTYFGIQAYFDEKSIAIKPIANITKNEKIVVESDWSSASYWYSIVALAEKDYEINLKYYKANSLQGDKVLVDIYKNFGVETIFNTDESMTLKKILFHQNKPFEANFIECPDIAQTVVITCFGLGLPCHITGLHTLKIKETDRLVALKTELTKFGAKIFVDHDSLTLEASIIITQNVTVKTYQDHRMAMSFAPLSLKTPLIIEDAEVVNKSYPAFWEDLEKIGINSTNC